MYCKITIRPAFPPPSLYLLSFHCLAPPLFLLQGIVQAKKQNQEFMQRLQNIQETASTNVERKEKGAAVQEDLDAKKRILLNLEKLRKDVGSKCQEVKKTLEVERK